MPASKLKHRRGAAKKSSVGRSLRLILLAGILIVLGVLTTLLGGLWDALNRQKENLLVHKELTGAGALTRPADSFMQAKLQQEHELSLQQQVLERKRRMMDEKADYHHHVEQNRHDVLLGDISHLRAKRGAPVPEIPPIKLPPPEQLGGPYPYPMEPPPAAYNIREQYEPLGGFRFAEYTQGDAPYQVTDEIRQKSDEVARVRRQYIKDMMQFSWKGYEERAFGMDEVKPVSGNPDNNWGGLGIQLVDCLDTLWLLGMKEEFWRARDWVRDHLNHNVGRPVSVFETTIRSLGGLLAAYDWSGDKAFLDKALDLGQRLGKSFITPTGIPWGQVNLATGKSNNIGWARGNAILSEFGSMQLEFRMLDQSVKSPETAQMRKKTEDVFVKMNAMSPPNGLFPYYLSNGDQDGQPRFRNDHLTFGAMADSFYEYMLKVWIQGGKVEPLYRNMYDKAMDGMHNELLQTSTPSGLVYIADKIGASRMDHKMDHLVCFMGGLLALGAYTDPNGLDSPRAQRDLKTGRALTYTCYQMYARMQTGISAEFVQFESGRDFRIGSGAPHYLLRPETVESFFILNQLTGDPVYREWGWEVFQSIEKYCRTKFGYGTLNTVESKTQQPRDKMETFFLAETVKYMYLLQDPDTEVDILNKHVFNTEAHPMRVFNVLDPAAFQK